MKLFKGFWPHCSILCGDNLFFIIHRQPKKTDRKTTNICDSNNPLLKQHLFALFCLFFDSAVDTRSKTLLRILAPNAKVHSGRHFFFTFIMGNDQTNEQKDSDTCILAEKRDRNLSLTKQATGGLANERPHAIENPLGRPQLVGGCYLQACTRNNLGITVLQIQLVVTVSPPS